MYYDLNRVGNPKDSFTFINPNYESLTNSVKFFEGDEILSGFVPDKPGMCALIDIKIYLIEKGVFEDYGFTICPLL